MQAQKQLQIPWLLKTVGRFLPHLAPSFSQAAAMWSTMQCLTDSIALYLTVVILWHGKF